MHEQFVTDAEQTCRKSGGVGMHMKGQGMRMRGMGGRGGIHGMTGKHIQIDRYDDKEQEKEQELKADQEGSMKEEVEEKRQMAVRGKRGRRRGKGRRGWWKCNATTRSTHNTQQAEIQEEQISQKDTNTEENPITQTDDIEKETVTQTDNDQSLQELNVRKRGRPPSVTQKDNVVGSKSISDGDKEDGLIVKSRIRGLRNIELSDNEKETAEKPVNPRMTRRDVHFSQNEIIDSAKTETVEPIKKAPWPTKAKLKQPPHLSADLQNSSSNKTESPPVKQRKNQEEHEEMDQNKKTELKKKSIHKLPPKKGILRQGTALAQIWGHKKRKMSRKSKIIPNIEKRVEEKGDKEEENENGKAKKFDKKPEREDKETELEKESEVEKHTKREKKTAPEIQKESKKQTESNKEQNPVKTEKKQESAEKGTSEKDGESNQLIAPGDMSKELLEMIEMPQESTVKDSDGQGHSSEQVAEQDTGLPRQMKIPTPPINIEDREPPVLQRQPPPLERQPQTQQMTPPGLIPQAIPTLSSIETHPDKPPQLTPRPAKRIPCYQPQKSTVLDESQLRLPQKKRHMINLARTQQFIQEVEEPEPRTTVEVNDAGSTVIVVHSNHKNKEDCSGQNWPTEVKVLPPRPKEEEALMSLADAAQKEQQVVRRSVKAVPVKTDLDDDINNADVIKELMKIATGTQEIEEPVYKEGKRPYKREFKVKCRFCTVKVKDYGYLFRHVKKLHLDHPHKGTYLEEIRPLMRTPCPICGKLVSSISNISSHIKQCHATKDSAVVCPLCEKTYKTPVSLRQHLRQCHQHQQKRFFCHMCSASFTENRSLKEHINCTHETTEVFCCESCGKTFLTKGRLRRHKYIHGDYRHRCGYCGKGFHLKDNMNKHIEIVHEKAHGKRFQCPHCGKRFTVKGNMMQHVMGVHLKQFQYNCTDCKHGFRRKKDLLSHMQAHNDPAHPFIDDDPEGLSEDEFTAREQLEALANGEGVSIPPEMIISNGSDDIEDVVY